MCVITVDQRAIDIQQRRLHVRHETSRSNRDASVLRAALPAAEATKRKNGKQGGDPAKLARALTAIADQEPPPLRFISGADAIETTQQKIATLQQEIDAFRGLSISLA